jgi:hypothetical protein
MRVKMKADVSNERLGKSASGREAHAAGSYTYESVSRCIDGSDLQPDVILFRDFVRWDLEVLSSTQSCASSPRSERGGFRRSKLGKRRFDPLRFPNQGNRHYRLKLPELCEQCAWRTLSQAIS